MARRRPQRCDLPTAARERLQRFGFGVAVMTVAPFPKPEPVTKDDISPEFSEDALALEFTSRYGHKLRYCAQWGAWLEWDETRWKFEKTLHAFDLARVVAREFANAPKSPERRSRAEKQSRRLKGSPAPIGVMPQRLIFGIPIPGS